MTAAVHGGRGVGNDGVTAGSSCDRRIHCELYELLLCAAVAIPNGAVGSSALSNHILLDVEGFPQMHPSV